MTPIPLLDGHTLLIDNSSLERFTTCPRSAEYAVCHRRRAAGDNTAQMFGKIMHTCLEARYRGVPPYTQTEAIEATMLAAADAAFVSWSPPDDDYRNRDRMVDLIHRYGLAYPFEAFDVVRDPSGTPFIEVPFAVPLGAIALGGPVLSQDMTMREGRPVPVGDPHVRTLDALDVVWTGRIDIAYEYSGGLYLMDHKSASMATNMAEFEISHQFYGYVWALERLLGRPVTGIVINRVVVRKPSRTGEPFTFERKLVAVQRGLVADWHQDCLHIVADFVEHARRGFFPKHTSWCVGKFGACQFHQVCQQDTPEGRTILLGSGEYMDNTWSPLT